jgi:hypothetical protein
MMKAVFPVFKAQGRINNRAKRVSKKASSVAGKGGIPSVLAEWEK